MASFGLSFGAKKSKGKSTTAIDKLVDSTQIETGAKSTTGTTTTSGVSTTTGNQTGQTSGATTNNSVGSQTNQQQSTLFSSGILQGLEGIIGSLFGSQATTPMQLNSNFDKSEFVEGGYRAAESRATDDLETGLNGMIDRIGARDDQNSMAMLLANRARNDTAANLAGVRSNLIGQAEGIARENFGADLAGQANSQGFLGNLLEALKGGSASTTGAIQTSESSTGTSLGTSANQTSENTNQSQTQIQDLLELLANAMSGREHTTGTETTKSKGTDMGGGFSIGL